MLNRISVLCVDKKSNYKKFPGLDLWDKERNAYLFNGKNPVITHAPCQQWSRLKKFAKENEEEKLLAWHCWRLVNENGGIFEHPAGSSFFEEAGADRSKIYSVNLHWFGFPAQKRTYLYFHGYKPLPMPMNFNAIEKRVDDLHSSTRSETPLMMITWMINTIHHSKL